MKTPLLNVTHNPQLNLLDLRKPPTTNSSTKTYILLSTKIMA
jgi:hypothetical protein